MSCVSMLTDHPSYVDSSPQRAYDSGSWRPDVLLKVSLSASREDDVVRLTMVSVLPPLLVPILLGGPFVLQGFLPLLEGEG